MVSMRNAALTSGLNEFWAQCMGAKVAHRRVDARPFDPSPQSEWLCVHMTLPAWANRVRVDLVNLVAGMGRAQ